MDSPILAAAPPRRNPDRQSQSGKLDEPIPRLLRCYFGLNLSDPADVVYLNDDGSLKEHMLWCSNKTGSASLTQLGQILRGFHSK